MKKNHWECERMGLKRHPCTPLHCSETA